MQQIAKSQAGARRFLQRKPDKPHLSADQGKAQRRVGELSRLYRDRYPRGLPHNELGVKWARYMCRTLAFLPHDDRAKWLDRNASWLDGDKRADILSMGPYMYGARSLGNHLELYDEDRERLGIRTIEACDVTEKQREKINLEKKHSRQEKWRRKKGVKPREQWLAGCFSRSRPWEALKISRRTWERRRQAAVASPRRSSLIINKGHAPATRQSAIETANNALHAGYNYPSRTSDNPAQPWYPSLKEAA